MNKKCRILFYNTDQMGVNYYRTLMPALDLDKQYSDDFYVEINPNINFDDPEILTYLTSFDIIHYHKELYDVRKYHNYRKALKDAGTILVMDIDDYWELSKTHPMYLNFVQNKIHMLVMKTLQFADYVTTTTELLAAEVRKVTGKDNVIVLPNAIDPDNMDQFQNNWVPDPDGRVRITYMGGSSHLQDLMQLEGVVNVLNADTSIKDKFKIILAGWDDRGKTSDINFNPEFLEDLKKANLFEPKTVKEINKAKGELGNIARIPKKIKEKYTKDDVYVKSERDLTAPESIYNKYEQILTDSQRIITDRTYISFLHKYDKNGRYAPEGNFARRWTQSSNKYANVLNETDIVLAPLEDNMFNRMKSNLKQVECWSRKLPIICSDMPPYDVDGRDMDNCILISTEKNAKKYWIKALKRLIYDADLRKQLGEQLFLDFKDKYHLSTVNKIRAEFYKRITNV